ncbi:uncharacterized protein CANTADRAFT_203960 [Suhomyces tanzawaensis NRRL Y-17324]|uniref:Actin-like ATPase domain-containing protein n=1 Tax=Suhomyces tanzawaensis NRRL Y-17324 TaxID=984487 RepID=A0A1E4SP52_9ASCO|nr:uncharacterized protein CANTADRAFT_203960 [Suhomyces tanzawaensis NRRL Y-17324]ODV81310.1 hypothetical protein CANTADRAFT_203960 [Suhomyces tanzawaensis NRRL Y-17324]
MSLSNEYTPIIAEIGTRNIRIGFAGDPLPSATQCTSAKYPYQFHDEYPQFLDVDDSAMNKHQRANVIEQMVAEQPEIKQLIQIYGSERHKWIHLNRSPSGRTNATEEDWHLQDLLADMLRDDLVLAPRRCKVILVDRGFSIATKFRLCEQLLNRFKFKSVITCPSAVLSVMGANERNGLVLDFGWESLGVSLVVDLRDVSQRIEEIFTLGGLTLHYMVVRELIRLDNPHVNEHLLARKDLFEIVEDFIMNGMFVLPYGERIDDHTLADFKITDDVFVPGLLRYKVVEDLYFKNESLRQSITGVLESTNIDTRPLLLDNVIIAGGVSGIPGFKYRMVQEIKAWTGAKGVVGKPTLGAWAGCSMYVSSVLVNEDKSVWKEQEVTRDIINSLTTENGVKLAGLPDSVNAIHKIGR